jgi:hypothetical protein
VYESEDVVTSTRMVSVAWKSRGVVVMVGVLPLMVSRADCKVALWFLMSRMVRVGGRSYKCRYPEACNRNKGRHKPADLTEPGPQLPDGRHLLPSFRA